QALSCGGQRQGFLPCALADQFSGSAPRDHCWFAEVSELCFMFFPF
uniref:Uncharacterized protein n=1 Tax=Aegilops tauschii subsp. strangulata TaxID=200361 RepID=A0A453EQL6_AEGTS